MATDKLTLSAEREVIVEAKRLAAETGTSVSAMFSRLLRAMAAQRGSPVDVGPITRQASGLVRLPPEASDRDLLGDALASKYGLR